MEHARKMLLVDANVSNDYKNMKRYYSMLDQSVSDVLNRDDLNEYDKIKLYQQTLNKYIIHRDNVVNELEQPVKVQSINQKETTAEEQVLAELSEPERQRAEKVLENVEAFTPLRFDKKGRMIRDGRIIEGSSLKELVHHELKQKKNKKTAPPIAWEFFSSYNKTNRPQRNRVAPRRVLDV
jgi:hypothetical protein